MSNNLEYILCRGDFFYFIELTKLINFDDYKVDVICKILTLSNNELVTIYGNRGCGLTTIGCLYVLWRTIFFPNENILFFSDSNILSHHIKNNFIFLYKKMLSYWNTENNITEIENMGSNYIKFNNKSYVSFKSTFEQIRGNHYNTIIFDNSKLDNDEINELMKYMTYNAIVLNTNY